MIQHKNKEREHAELTLTERCLEENENKKIC